MPISTRTALVTAGSWAAPASGCSLVVDLGVQHPAAHRAGGEDDVGESMRVLDPQGVGLRDVALDVTGATAGGLATDQVSAEELLADQAIGQGHGWELVAAVGVEDHLGGRMHRGG